MSLLREIRSCLKGRASRTAIKPEDAVPQFFRSGIDYYVAGRFSFFAGANYVAANLLHHAVEMCLKGGLAKKGMTLPELTNLRHRLPKIWRRFKQRTDGASLDKFDAVIAALHKYEKIRYPDPVLEHGMQSLFALHKLDPATVTKGTTNVPEFVLCLEEVDELISAIFKSASINWAFFPLNKVAKGYLNKENRWVP